MASTSSFGRGERFKSKDPSSPGKSSSAFIKTILNLVGELNRRIWLQLSSGLVDPDGFDHIKIEILEVPLMYVSYPSLVSCCYQSNIWTP